MTKRIFGAPLTNIINRQTCKKQIALTEAEQVVLTTHSRAEQKEICSMAKYSNKIMTYYETLDNVFIFKEKDITFEMRSLLADWLISCTNKLSLSDDTYYLGIHLIDRFLSGRSISTSKLQLVGITALVIAAKYEEVLYPDLGCFISLSDQSFTECEVKRAEKYMLYSLDYKLDYVNPLLFLRRAAKANNYEARSRKMAKYFLELMFLYPNFMKYKKNILGTTAMYLARKICQTDYNKNLLFFYSKVDRTELKCCFDDLVKLIYSDPKYENLENKYANTSSFDASHVARAYARKYFN